MVASDEITREELLYEVRGLCMRIHRQFGSGLLEKAYQRILAAALVKSGHKVETEVSIPIEFEGIVINDAFRADLIVDDKLIIELKAVEKMSNAYFKQLGTYLVLSGKPWGFMVNFQNSNLMNGMYDLSLDKVKSKYYREE